MSQNEKRTHEYAAAQNPSAWEQFKTKDEKFAACRIPKEQLSSMTTEELIEAILAYPLLEDIFCYDNPFGGIDYLRRNFEGFDELFKRNDLSGAFLKIYAEDKVLTESQVEEQSIGYKQFFRLKAIETIIAYKDVIGKFSEEDLKQLSDVALTKYEQKKMPGAVVSSDHFYGRLSSHERVFGKISIPDALRDRLRATEVTVKTPAGKVVRDVWIRGELLSTAEKQNNESYVRTRYPRAKILSESTTNYNCHSYAWYFSNEERNKYWMNDPRNYMEKESYKKVDPKNLEEGDRIFYNTPDPDDSHSGLVRIDLLGNSKIVSKWGQLPLVKHEYNDSPYDSSNVEFWRCQFSQGIVNFENKWGGVLNDLCIRHRRGNKAEYEDIISYGDVQSNEIINGALQIYYKTGIGSPFDYWWLKFRSGISEYTIKDDFFCYLSSSDNGTVNLKIDVSTNKLSVAFSKSSGCSVGIEKKK